ncbi:UvrD-helicase domain-containing protein [Acetonema longum]|uniref:DNA 3'-5' helicase n=1 Tax=Acetonema longum DSM 6540 TaxID=1009370 RepID=F7NN59_9FIRM|nr:UvrD-helicase domain-containing protein [Acetonema longum]EGO62525.1 hypothetical protein ALO_17711 [Acetonema longum DSM 6540]
MFIADLHIHSKYSRATSKDCSPEMLDFWARRKGIQVLGTGDFTHPAWRQELKDKLIPSGEGLYALKDEYRQSGQVAGGDIAPQFIISGEISSIYKKNGRVRKVHNVVLLPGLEQAEVISRRLEAIGNVRSDGRPILGLDSRDLLEIVLDSCPEAIFIPAHIWTPHFSLFGAYSGFDDIYECFGDLTDHIYALETGLSSDPPMNWRLSALDRFTLVSNSDAHSPANLGREVNLFNTQISYPAMLQALKNRHTQEFYGTIEFFPHEGKYHYDGHRNCHVCWKPSQTRDAGGICPVCGGRITVGVLHRVEVLADREEGFVPTVAKHFESLVPLAEVIAASIGATTASKKVQKKYGDLLSSLGPEFFILREASLPDIERAAGACIAEGIRRLRCGQVEIQSGYDGEYGKVKILDKSEIDQLSGQLCFIEAPQASTTEPATAKPISSLESGPVQKGSDARPDEEARTRRSNDADRPFSTAPYGLNAEQWMAVSASEPALAVIAGPGTGKTKTLVSRIAYLVEQCGVSPSQITAVTFTNKAAREMRLRLEKHFGSKRTAAAMTIGTFHAICLKMLSEWRGKNSVTILDPDQASAIMGDVLQGMALKQSPRDVLRRLSLLKNGAANSRKESDIPAGVYEAYRDRLAHYGVMDYDDILLEVLQRFEAPTADVLAGGKEKKPFVCLLVDEFQDINEVQYRLIQQWGKNSQSIFIIGDPDQSIYGFRGSDSRYFDRFIKDSPGIRQVRLTQNYRSTPEVLAAAKGVISRKISGEPAPLEAVRGSGAKIRLVAADSDFSEALFVAKEINRLVGGIDMLDAHGLAASHKKKPQTKQARGFSDIAVLYRTNRQAQVLEQCLIKEGIPYTVAGREDFLADSAVREAVAFFRFLLNPEDLASLLLCLKAVGQDGMKGAPGIMESYAAGKRSLPALIKILENVRPPRDGLEGFRTMLQRYDPVIRKEKPWKTIAAWMQEKDVSVTGSLELLFNMAVMHDTMPAFLQNLALGQDSDLVRSSGKVYSSEAVSLMTMHAAKGLEFPVVFICGVNEDTIPLRNSSSGCDPEEERRLFYVGITRAQDELILLVSRSVSPFVAAIDKEQLIREKAFTPRQTSSYKQDGLF